MKIYSMHKARLRMIARGHLWLVRHHTARLLRGIGQWLDPDPSLFLPDPEKRVTEYHPERIHRLWDGF
jgi:hypothetical protein